MHQISGRATRHVGPCRLVCNAFLRSLFPGFPRSYRTPSRWFLASAAGLPGSGCFPWFLHRGVVPIVPVVGFGDCGNKNVIFRLMTPDEQIIPGFDRFPGLLRWPLTCTCPAPTASAASRRVRKNRLAHSHLSSRCAANGRFQKGVVSGFMDCSGFFIVVYRVNYHETNHC